MNAVHPMLTNIRALHPETWQKSIDFGGFSPFELVQVPTQVRTGLSRRSWVLFL